MLGQEFVPLMSLTSGLPAFSLAGVVDYLTGARTGVFEGRTLGRGEGTFLAAKVC
jgi:hypothetical protein